MDKILETLLANQVLSDETKAEITEAYDSMLKTINEKAESKIRGELAARYEADKSAMVEALSKYLDQGIKKEIKEFKDDVKQLNALKLRYTNALSSLKEQARKQVLSRMKAVEARVNTVLQKEITELHEDIKTTRKAYVRSINENAAKLEAEREAFKVKAAKVLENIINVKMKKEIQELKEDIRAAKQINFGNEIFETFYNVFRRQFFDTNSEFKALKDKYVAEHNQKVALTKVANKKLAEAKAAYQEVVKERNMLKESATRQKTMNRLLGTLTGSARNKMATLLETAETKNLDKTFKQFVGDILNEDKQPRQKRDINEAVSAIQLETGSRKKLNESAVQDDDLAEILEIGRLAGIRK